MLIIVERGVARELKFCSLIAVQSLNLFSEAAIVETETKEGLKLQFDSVYFRNRMAIRFSSILSQFLACANCS
jgi:hypothetical protein